MARIYTKHTFDMLYAFQAMNRSYAFLLQQPLHNYKKLQNHNTLIRYSLVNHLVYYFLTIYSLFDHLTYTDLTDLHFKTVSLKTFVPI